jgi:hypothetical protein
MYLLIVFSDLEQQDIIFVGYFKKIRDIIEYTNGVCRYTDSVPTCPEAITKHKTVKKLFKIIKI